MTTRNPTRTANQPDAGGFLPSPPASSTGILSPASTTGVLSPGTSHNRHFLPTPRHHPLKPGSPKETAFINYVDKGIQEVGRKFALKRGGEEGFGRVEEDENMTPQEWETGSRPFPFTQTGGRGSGEDGYTSFKEVAADLERLVDVVWVSGTPSLQIPYLLTLALHTTTYIPAFPAHPPSLFHLLSKLDVAFASLLLKSDVVTGELLPGFEGARRRGVSGTEKVRVKSLVERTRVVVVEVVVGGLRFEEGGKEGREEMGTGTGMETETETETEMEGDGEESGMETEGDGDAMEEWSGGNSRDWEMDVARVYVRTLEELGDELGGPAIGIPGS